MGEGVDMEGEPAGRLGRWKTGGTEKDADGAVGEGFTWKKAGSEGKETGRWLRDGLKASNSR